MSRQRHLPTKLTTWLQREPGVCMKICTRSLFSFLSRCQNSCLDFYGDGTSLSGSISPVEVDGALCYHPDSDSSKVMVNHQQAKSDKEVNLINPMVLMLTSLISHPAHLVAGDASDAAFGFGI